FGPTTDPPTDDSSASGLSQSIASRDGPLTFPGACAATTGSDTSRTPAIRVGTMTLMPFVCSRPALWPSSWLATVSRSIPVAAGPLRATPALYRTPQYSRSLCGVASTNQPLPAALASTHTTDEPSDRPTVQLRLRPGSSATRNCTFESASPFRP